MESLLWAADLLGVLYLCFWALREDKKQQQPGHEPKQD